MEQHEQKSMPSGAYIIDLDLPPGDRWDHVIRDNDAELRQLSENFTSILKSQFNGTIARLRKYVLRPLCSTKPIHNTYSKELAGIAKITSTYGLSYGDLVLFNTALDFLAKCTSVVASTSEGQIHARTLDWDLPELKRLTIVVTFVRKGSPMYKGVTFVGCVGLLTGVRILTPAYSEAFSLSYNFRKTLKSKKRFLNHFMHSYYTRLCISFLLRNVLENCNGFNEAKLAIVSEKVSLCGYVVISGSRIFSAFLFAVGTDPYTDGPSTIIVQTNHDPELEELEKIPEAWIEGDTVLCSTIERKQHALQFLSSKHVICGHDVERIMMEYPIQNESTIFTCIMKPGEGVLQLINRPTH